MSTVWCLFKTIESAQKRYRYWINRWISKSVASWFVHVNFMGLHLLYHQLSDIACWNNVSWPYKKELLLLLFFFFFLLLIAFRFWRNFEAIFLIRYEKDRVLCRRMTIRMDFLCMPCAAVNGLIDIKCFCAWFARLLTVEYWKSHRHQCHENQIRRITKVILLFIG